VLSCEFSPVKPNVICTTGLDHSIKFWDIRRFDETPLNVISNNSHWIWSAKYNKAYSRIMITSSSSSQVRCIIFDNENEEINTNSYSYTSVDYLEFDDAVYSLEWDYNDPWVFAAVSYNGLVHINIIPEDIKYNVMMDN